MFYTSSDSVAFALAERTCSNCSEYRCCESVPVFQHLARKSSNGRWEQNSPNPHRVDAADDLIFLFHLGS